MTEIRDDVEQLLEDRRPSTEEYAARLARVQQVMAERGWAALVVSDPANMLYLSGYDAWSFYTPQCLVVPVEGEPHLFARAMDAAGAGHTSHLTPERIHGYPEELVHRPDVHPFDHIAAAARELGLLPAGPEIVAVEGDAHFFSPRGYLAIQAALPAATLVDSRELVNWVRVTKSPFEIRQLRVAGEIASNAMRAALAAICVGRKQSDVVAEIFAAQVTGTPEHGGDYPAIVPMLPTGAAAGIPHLTWTDTPFVAGESTTIELAGVYRRYHAPLARTISLGKPSAQLVSTADAITEGMAAALDALRPGMTGEDVHARFNAVLLKHGLSKESRIGYSIGIGYPPDWGERTVSLRAGETTVVTEGMAFHVILGMWMDGWGYELSEPVVVGADGAERLTDLPQELTVRQ